MNLLSLMDLYAGGPGSGCNPAAGQCGRPLGKATLKMYKDILRKTGVSTRGKTEEQIVRTYKAWARSSSVRQSFQQLAKKSSKEARAKIAKAHLKKIGTTTPGLKKSGGRIHIDIKPVWKGRVKSQYVATGGHKVTELKGPKQYEKSGRTWLNKPDKYRSQYLVDTAEQKELGNPKGRNSFWIHMERPDAGRSVEVRRDLGQLKVAVVERTLGDMNQIIQHREVEFKNIGRASGFLNKRYGITFKLK